MADGTTAHGTLTSPPALLPFRAEPGAQFAHGLHNLAPGLVEPGFMAGSNPLLSEIFTRISPNPSHCAPITAARRRSNLGLPTPNFVWRSPIWNPGSLQPMAAAVASPKLGFAFVRREGARGGVNRCPLPRGSELSLSEVADGRWDDSGQQQGAVGQPAPGRRDWKREMPFAMDLGFGHGGHSMSYYVNLQASWDRQPGVPDRAAPHTQEDFRF